MPTPLQCAQMGFLLCIDLMRFTNFPDGPAVSKFVQPRGLQPGQRLVGKCGIAHGGSPCNSHFYIVFVAVYFLQQSKHAGQMLRVDVIKQQHHHGETHGKGAGVLKIRLQKFPHRLRKRAGQLQSAAKAVAHRPIIYFRHESSGAGQNLLRRRADSTNDHSLQHDFFKRAVSCGIQIGGPIPLGNAARKAAQKPQAAEEEVKTPPAEPCTASVAGIEVMDLEDAAKALWKAGIYAETGMGCTGPLVMMSEANHAKALEILRKAGYVS